jgi:hypothetical protein
VLSWVDGACMKGEEDVKEGEGGWWRWASIGREVWED